MIKIPWKAEDAERHMKGLSPMHKENWAKIANSVLAQCMKDGGSQGECEGRAVRIANAKAKGTTEAVDVSFSMPILEAAILDKDKGIYDLTLIKEGSTEDRKRYYPRSTLERAVSLFEGAQAFVDHPSKSEMKERPERSVRDLIGYYETAQVTETGDGVKLKAKLITSDAQAWIRPILNMAVTNPKLCGSSIHADGTVSPKAKDGMDLVESIDSVFSVDIVTKPNAGGKIERLIASQREGGGEDELKIEELTIDELRKSRADLLEGLEKEIKEKVEKEAKEKADKEKGSFVPKADFETLKESYENTLIESKIQGSKILDVVKDQEDKKTAKGDLTASMKGKTEEEMDKVIESRKVFLKGLGVKVEGNAPKENQDTGKGYHIGTLLPEAKRAWVDLNIREVS